MNDIKLLNPDSQPSPADLDLTRRQFLKISGSGIILLFTVGDQSLLAQERFRRDLPTDFNAYLKISEDGRVACYTGKIEMGQGVYTSLAQMLADEIDADLSAVDMVMGDTELCPYDMGTWGSMSTRFFGPALRLAGAEAREILAEIGAEHLGVSSDKVSTANGHVFLTSDPGKKVSYGELAKGKKIVRHLKGKASLKKPTEFNIMSKPVTRLDAEEKVRGKAQYAGDIRLPGMLYAKVLRPPSHEAKLVDVDLSAARQIPGIDIVRDGDFVAVLHRYPDVAEMALTKIKATFDHTASGLNDENIFDHLLKVAPAGNAIASGGDLTAGKREAGTIAEKTYLNDYVAHAPVEPHTATVRIEGGHTTVWASTQTPFMVRDAVAKELGVSTETVRVMPIFVGGGFGGKGRFTQAVEAARIAKLCGKPVQLAWSRAEEFFLDSFRPAAIVKIASGISAKGRICYWDYHVYYAGDRGAAQFYDIPNHSTTTYSANWSGAPGAHPFSTGAWRAPGNNTNTFARESQIDIMAENAGVDPVEFRLQHLNDQKMRKVLKSAAEKFGWTSAKSPSGRGCGVALGLDAGTCVAAMAEVQVDKLTGGVTVRRVVAVQDMGLSINPEGAKIQMEGCIMMGLGYALTEGIHFDSGKIADLNFDSYELPRFSWLPAIETIVIDNKDADPQGGGEPAIVTMGAVIANAIYDATGARLFRLPMTSDRIKAAIEKK